MKKVVFFLLDFYRYGLSSFRQTLGMYGVCRYYPTCSQYCREAVQKHGIIHGLYLCLRRLMRCHPWGAAGWDPVPEKSNLGIKRTKKADHPLKKKVSLMRVMHLFFK
ncbi:membrane protein insertion efficiency factor YidD [Candidatus Methylacidiphilum infernorum]|uniref:Putative membrane protein insertion efficiency factor n=1 Tax=Methylacidiphilum infernorum (isolate V4) TaxID=481448 RepID=YIDD_METI4|nr:membrane protein insertion efficiency factor YidD [Candidatus Methylacidiphilum infernorum]B3DUH7.1 RecName: Full=Putative membrane protein insertion efficiency factor [Methylacidiphilum infernorum V4]ACD82980.1 Uncharacterized conserved protein, HlyA family [Methylacidiphilum infernorum V4]